MKLIFTLPLILLLSPVAFGQEPITVFLAGDSTMAQKLPEKREYE